MGSQIYLRIKHSTIIGSLTISQSQFSSVAQLCLTLRSHGLQYTRPPCISSTSKFTQTHVPWVGDAIQPSHPLSLPSPPAFNLSQHQGFSNEAVLCIKQPKYWSLSFSINPSNEYSGLISFRINWFGSPCSPRDSQESSPTPQFKRINSLALSFLYSPTLTFIHDDWKNHSFDQMDLCWQSNVSAF